MGYNSPKWDKEAHYKQKSIKQLQDELNTFKISYDQFMEANNGLSPTFWVEHIEYLRTKIAERIGK